MTTQILNDRDPEIYLWLGYDIVYASGLCLIAAVAKVTESGLPWIALIPLAFGLDTASNIDKGASNWIRLIRSIFISFCYLLLGAICIWQKAAWPLWAMLFVPKMSEFFID